MVITSINHLCKYLRQCSELRYVLCAYTGRGTLYGVIDEFCCQDYFVVLGDALHISEDDAREWIIDNWRSPADCEVVEEEGPNGKWAVVSIKCAGKQLLLDWEYNLI